MDGEYWSLKSNRVLIEISGDQAWLSTKMEVHIHSMAVMFSPAVTETVAISAVKMSFYPLSWN